MNQDSNSSLPDFKAPLTTKAIAHKKIISGPFEKLRLTNQNFQGTARTSALVYLWKRLDRMPRCVGR